MILAVISPGFTAVFVTPSFTDALDTSASTNPSIALFNAVTAASTSASVALVFTIVALAFSNAKLTAAHDSGL